MDAHCHERWTMKSRGIPRAKHALSGLISALLMCIESAAQPEFISPNRTPLATPAGGGCFEVGHRVLGVSWGELSWCRWTLKDDSNLREWASAFVMVPNLDAKRWSRLPHQGQRMGLWLSSKKERHAWTMQWTWSPSQQETFRCALRWRWDA